MEDKQSEVGQPQPGATFSPGDTSQATAPEQQPVATVQGSQSAPEITPDPMPRSDDPNRVTWTASEFVEHSKSFDWYLALGVVAILAAAGFYLAFRDLVTTIVILGAALTLGYYGRRKPRQLDYALDSHGVTIGAKYLPYDQYRSFAVMEEDHFSSISLLPLKRFGLLTTLYYDPRDEERILSLISQHLPLEPREHDPIERLMKRIRF